MLLGVDLRTPLRKGEAAHGLPAWRRNQKALAAGAPFGRVRSCSVSGSEPLQLDVRVSTYRWLLDRVTLDENLTHDLRAWLAKNPSEYPWSWVDQRVHSDGDLWDGGPDHGNTFNQDTSPLDTEIDYSVWSEQDHADYQMKVALRLHIGTDVRAGYSRPAVFDIDEADWNFPETIIGSQCGPAWYCESGTGDWIGSWSSYDDGKTPQDLNEFEVIGPRDVTRMSALFERAGTGVVVIAPDLSILCPITGAPLEVFPRKGPR